MSDPIQTGVGKVDPTRFPLPRRENRVPPEPPDNPYKHVRGFQVPDRVIAKEGQLIRVNGKSSQPLSAELRPSEPKLEPKAPMMDLFVDRLTILVVNLANKLRSTYYAVRSITEVYRWGWVRHHIAVKRSSHCFGAGGSKACPSLFWDETTSDWYCAGGHGGSGCGCGQTKKASLYTKLTLMGAECPMGLWGKGYRVKHVMENQNGSENVHRCGQR